MKLSPILVIVLLAASAPQTSAAVEIELAPRYQRGDSYALSLTGSTTTEAASGRSDRGFEERVQLRYAANVVVLETDAEGRALRERHEDVHLRYERPDGSGSLFQPGASLELRRDRDGDLRVHAGGKRIDRKVEKVVAGLLATQFEHGLAPALFEPGREVEVGESWSLDGALARRFLRERGIRVVQLGDGATARLERQGEDDDAELVVRFAIPIEWLELDGIPKNTRASHSDGRFEGTIRLSPDPLTRPAIYASRLVTNVDGFVGVPGGAHAQRWSFARWTLSDQRTLRMASRDVADLARY